MPSADLSVAIQAEPRLEQGDEHVRWNLATRLAFRVVFCYFVLFGLDCLAILVLFLGYDLLGRISPSLLTDAIWKKVVPWVASHLLHVHGSIGLYGGSDSVYGYTRVLAPFIGKRSLESLEVGDNLPQLLVR